ncbi:MAG: Bug family tripartite tricarboxylate transporter substrate binding protein [Burkholderiales bacterium]
MIRIAHRISATALAGSFLVANQVQAQSYPVKPIRIVVPFTAGSLPDLVPRLVGEKASPVLGQPIIVENRVGAGGRIAAEAVSKAIPDGYTLLLGTATTHLVAPFLVKNMPYDSFKDFTPIINGVSPVTGFVTSMAVPATSVREFIDYAKKYPGKLAYGSNGIGSSHHLRGEFLKMVAGIDLIHVPYPGSNEVVTGVVTDTVQLTFSTPASIGQHVAAGKARMLAVTMPKRVPAMANLPTLDELLPGFFSTIDWFGFFGPAGLPAPIVARLNTEIGKALNHPDIRSKFESQSIQIVGGTPEEFSALMKSETAIYAKVAKAAGIKPE